MSNIVWKIKTFEEFTVPELYAVLKARIDVLLLSRIALILIWTIMIRKQFISGQRKMELFCLLPCF
jgi:hypothetical protein